MSDLIEIRVVVAVAAIMVIASLLLNSFAAFGKHARRDHVAFVWLAATNVAFLAGTTGLLLSPIFPFWLSAVLVIGGMLFGLLIGYVALSVAIGDRPHPVFWLGLGGGLGLAQGALAVMTGSVESLILSSSGVNGVLGLVLARRLWRRSRSFGVELAVLASAPFFVIGLAYLARLMLIKLGVGNYALAVATLLITLLMAFSALQWSFALLSFRAARLNLHLRTAREKAEQASTLKSRLLANMSHELRTPLNGVLGMVQALRPNLTDTQSVEMLEAITDSAQDLLGRLTDILDHSALQSGALSIQRVPFDLHEVLAQVVAPYHSLAVAKGLVFDLSYSPECRRWWEGDAGRLSQILTKLLENAVNFTRIGTIAVAVSDSRGGVRISISDTGIGMTTEQQRVVFDPFVQADLSATRHVDGAGLGLSVARGLAEAMGGQLALTSEFGRGSMFTVDLPLLPSTRPSAAARVVASGSVRNESPAEKMNVLVAEDNKANQRVLRALMKDTRANLTIVENGALAVAQSEQQDFDLFLFDIMMPEMDGASALLQITAQLQGAGRPVPPALAITANVAPEQLDQYTAAGFAGVIAKPVRKPDLLALIARHT